MSGGESDATVVVAVRIRPKLESASNALQSAERYQPEAITKMSDDTISISEAKGKDVKSAVFTFDRVFDRDSTQEELYEDAAVGAVDAALQGFNSTIMTYGQTGSGKTYTVLGSVKANPLATDVVSPETGLFLRAVRDILRYAEARASELHVVVGISVIEVYLENARDLLGKDATKTLKMQIDNENVALPELTVSPIQSLRDAIQVYRVATSKRVARATDANDQSSRSHALFCVEIFQQPRAGPEEMAPTVDDLVAARDRYMNKLVTGKVAPRDALTRFALLPGSQPVVYSKVVLTDLAGSEKLKHSNAKGDSFEEMKKINGSLTSLGNVVHALFTGQKHIPYRDSKLTIILRSSFASPSAHVVLIANVAPTQLTFDETMSTLFFANKVKAMKSQSTATTEIRSEAQYLETLRTLEELCADLRIVGEGYSYVPVISSGLLPREDALRKALRLQTVVKREPGGPWPVGITTADPKSHPRFGAVASLLGDRAKKWKERDEGLTRAREEALGEFMSEHRKRREYAESYYEKAASRLKETREEIAASCTGFERQIVEEETAEGLVATQRATLRDKANQLKASISAARAQRKVEDDAYAKLKEQLMNAHSGEERIWRETEVAEQRSNAAWEQTTKRRAQLVEFLSLLKEYYELRKAIRLEYATAVELRTESNRIEIRDFLRELVSDCARQAVVTVQIRRKASFSSPPPPPGRPPARGAPPSPSTHADPLSPGPGSPSNRVVKKPAVPRRPIKPPSIFDSPTLMDNILEYVACGATLLKHGRSGQPHSRYFYVATKPSSDGSGKGTPFMCWTAEDVGTRLITENSIDLTRIEKVQLGKNTDVFSKTYKYLPEGLQRAEYYCSFSLLYHRKNEARSLDVVCDSPSEMESWVIAMCHYSGLNPTFGVPMGQVQIAPEMNDIPSEYREVAAELCSQWHVHPKLFVTLLHRLDDLCTKRRMRVAILTPGELCAIAQLDIFRSTAIWNAFVALELVLRPSYPFGRSYLEYSAQQLD